jgi:hypothetical protein
MSTSRITHKSALNTGCLTHELRRVNKLLGDYKHDYLQEFSDKMPKLLPSQSISEDDSESKAKSCNVFFERLANAKQVTSVRSDKGDVRILIWSEHMEVSVF